ncbi:MAG: helix-turn-helix domain-containing protein [Betaproteobacteria bacterium]|nr:helix-turn-helix domain-containing protein [Betaproteobacteria bacterium]
MSALNNERYIPWFNPREMADSTVMALATGREELLRDFITVVRQRLENPIKPTASAHWLVTGQRGAGKSFFLRYAQIEVPKNFPDGKIRFVLLPEELRNVRAPHDLLDEIHHVLKVAQGDPDSKHGRAATWRTENPEKLWEKSLKKLLATFSEPLLIVGIENFANLFKKVFSDDVAASLLRKLMEHEPRILLLATAVDGSFDENYANRFYQQFAKRPLPNWNSQAHRKYLEERARLIDCTPTPEQLARIDAYSRYTGGNARIAAIIAAAILDEQDIVNTSDDLNATIDKISDYYRAQLDALPKNSEILFDALIRGGEPCSQTQLAERVEARQSDISQAFNKLIELGYLHVDRPKGQKKTHYRVADRLFAEWYRMRYLDPGQRSRLAVMADLLADIITFKDKLRYAERFLTQGEGDDAEFMTELAYRERGIDIKPLRAAGINLLDCARRMPTSFENPLDVMEMFSSDADMRKSKEEALTLAKNCNPHFNGKAYSGEKFADLVLGNLFLGTPEKLIVLRAIPTFDHFQWDGLIKGFSDEKLKLADYAVQHIESFQILKKVRKNEWQHPWLDGWRDIRFFQGLEAYYVEQWPKTDFEIVKTAICAVEWLHRFREGDELAPQTFGEFLNSTIETAFDHEWWDEPLQIYQRLLDALPDTKDCDQELAILLAFQSEAFNQYDRHEQTLQAAQKTLTLIADQTPSTELNKQVRELAFGKAGWALGMLNRWSEALETHQKILPLLKDDDEKALHTGQAARYLWRLEGITSAWELIARQNLEKDDLAYCIGQLGDGVCDTQRVDGIPQAYAAGRELLTNLIERANAWTDKQLLEKSIRYVFINMLDTGLDLSVLQDLAQDLHSFAPEVDELVILADTLYRWFSELRNPDIADKNTPPPDPDWATTVTALNEELTFKARLRLGLAETPRLSPEAASVFMRVLAFIK